MRLVVSIVEMSKNYDVLLKLLLLGDSGVGKTSLLCRYVDEEVRSTHVATIGLREREKETRKPDEGCRCY